MSLIRCTECGREVSDRAASCPACGAPVGADHATTIEQTSKRWKGWQIFGVVMTILGIIIAASGAASRGGRNGVIAGVILLAVGLGAYIIARIGAWWHHG